MPNLYQAPAGLLEEKTILITGAGAGIGAEAATTFAAYGATCILLGKTVSKLEQVYDRMGAADRTELHVLAIKGHADSPQGEDHRRLLRWLYEQGFIRDG